MNHSVLVLVAAAICCCAAAPSAPAQTTYQETEPNDTKSQASGPFVMRSGDRITGSFRARPGSFDQDYWLIQTAPVFGSRIFRHELRGSPDQPGPLTLRGLTQSGGVIDRDSDVPIQSFGDPIRWYGFGRSERVYLKTTALHEAGDYTYTLRTDPVVSDLLEPTLAAGPIRIEVDAGGGNADLWVYDVGNYSPIPGYGNDDSPVRGSEPSLRRTFPFEPGYYLLAIATGNLANDQPSPADDTNRDGDVLEFPNAVARGDGPDGQPRSVMFTHGNPPRTEVMSIPNFIHVHFIGFSVAPPNAVPEAFARGGVTPVEQGASSPALTFTSQEMYAAMRRDVQGSSDIAVRRSTDRGATFGAPVGIPGSTQGFDPHAAASANGDVHVGFAKPGAGGMFDIVVSRSDDGGRTWTNTTLDSGGFTLGAPDVATIGSDSVLTSFHRERQGILMGHDVVVRISRDRGVTYGAPVTLSPTGSDARDASVAASGNQVYVTWVEYGPTPSVRGRGSSDGGATWSAVETVAVLNGLAGNARPDVELGPGGAVAVVWADRPPGEASPDIFVSQSGGPGAPFSAPANASRTENRFSQFPSVVRQHSLFHVFWTDQAGNGFEAFHSSVAVGSAIPPTVARVVSGSPGTPSAFPGAAADGDFLALAVTEITAQSSDVVVHTTSAVPWYAMLGSGGCGGEFGTPSWSVQGDQTAAHTLTVGPVAPGALGALALAPALAAVPFPLVSGCLLELDLGSMIAIPAVADPTGTFAIQVGSALPPGTIHGQAAFLDAQQLLVLSATSELRN